MGLDKIFITTAQTIGAAYGVFPSVTLAQFILESNWGRRNMGVFNYFGVKYSSKRHKSFVLKRTWEQKKDGKVDYITAKFAAFSTIEESFVDHAQLLNTKRYAPVLAAKTQNEAARELQKCGYATDLHYADKLIAIMMSANLYQYDKASET